MFHQPILPSQRDPYFVHLILGIAVVIESCELYYLRDPIDDCHSPAILTLKEANTLDKITGNDTHVLLCYF